MFRAALADYPGRPLICFGDRVLTVGEVGEQAEAIAAALADSGVGPGDRVAIQLQNVPEYAIGIIAAWRAGAAAVTVNPMATRADVLHLIADSGARAYIGERAAATALGPDAVPLVVTADGTGPQSWPGLLARYAGRHAPEPNLGPGLSRAGHLHLGHHRRAEGRAEHAREPRLRRRGLPALGQARARRRRAGRRPAVPHHRDHRPPRRQPAGPGPNGAARPVRPRRRFGRGRTAPGQLYRGGCHRVHRHERS